MAQLVLDRWRWPVVWLLFFATMLNYMDRLALNNTQRYVLQEFEEDPARRNVVYANIQFAFGMSFALFQVVAGFLIDRYSLRFLYLMAIIIWSTAGLLTGFVPAGAVGMLMACRVALGIGEAFNWPCAVACVRRVIPRESRGLANGIFHSGASVGAIATPLLVLLLVNTSSGEGWRNVFVFVGASGIVWAIVWMLYTQGQPARVIDNPNESVTQQNVPFWPIFKMTRFWICLLTGISVNLTWHFYNQWFPRFLTEDLQLPGGTEQWILAGFFLAADIGSMTAGWTIRAITRSGFSVEMSRKIVMTGLAAIVLGTTIPAAYLSESLLQARLACFFVVAAASMGGFSIFFSLAQDIVAQRTALLLGICGCMSWVVISLATQIVGQVARPGAYSILFAVIGCVPLVAAFVGWLWPETPAPEPDAEPDSN